MTLANDILECPTPADPPMLETIIGDRLDFRPVQTFAPCSFTLDRPSKSAATIAAGVLVVDVTGWYTVRRSAGGYTKTRDLRAFPPELSKLRPQLRGLVNDPRVPPETLAEVLAAPSVVPATVNLLNWLATEDKQPAPGLQMLANGELLDPTAQGKRLCVHCGFSNEPDRVTCERCECTEFHTPLSRRYQFHLCRPCGNVLAIPLATGARSNDRNAHQPLWSKGWIQAIGDLPPACSSACHEANANALEAALAPPPAPPPVELVPAPVAPRPASPVLVESNWRPS